MSLLPKMLITYKELQYEESLQPGFNFIGRNANSSTATIKLKGNDSKVSRNHCCIELKYDIGGTLALLLSDKESSNGTILCGFRDESISRNDEIYLRHNDEILIGDTIVKIIIPIELNMVKAELIAINEDKVKTAIWATRK